MSANSICDKSSHTSGKWNLKPSRMAQSVLNPIRQIVDGMTIAPNPDKELIKLTIGRLNELHIDINFNFCINRTLVYVQIKAYICLVLLDVTNPQTVNVRAIAYLEEVPYFV